MDRHHGPCLCSIKANHFDPTAEATKVRSVLCQELRLLVDQHGGHDVGVMDLPPADPGFTAEHVQTMRNCRTILEDIKKLGELTDTSKRRADRERGHETLRPRYDGKVFSQDLTAQAKRNPLIVEVLKRCLRRAMKGCGCLAYTRMFVSTNTRAYLPSSS
jgi:hypothetical protein